MGASHSKGAIHEPATLGKRSKSRSRNNRTVPVKKVNIKKSKKNLHGNTSHSSHSPVQTAHSAKHGNTSHSPAQTAHPAKHGNNSHTSHSPVQNAHQ